MRLRQRSGRVFTGADGAGSPRVAVVNETFAREVLGGGQAVGQRMQLGLGDEPWEVIGVVADIRNLGVPGTGPRAEAFVSMHQMGAGPVTGFDAPFIVADDRRPARGGPLPARGGGRRASARGRR